MKPRQPASTNLTTSTFYRYTLVSTIFGLWFFISCGVCCYFIEERCQLKGVIERDEDGDKPDEERDPEESVASLVVNLLNTLNNKPFTSLLPAWCFDTFGR